MARRRRHRSVGAQTITSPPSTCSTWPVTKPAQSLAMTFSADPNLGMTTGRFDGPAVVFVATATFTTQMTASLR